MSKQFDFIIIGSGLGGLVSALILAKEGKRVCILEKNNQFGGNLQTFSRDKLIFDTGVHYLGGLSEGQNLYEYFKFLGIIPDLKLNKMDENGFDIITFDDDEIQYPHAQGYKNFVEQLATIFPDERKNLEEYCAKIQEICNGFAGYNVNLEGSYNNDGLYIKTKDFIDSVTKNPKLRLVLAGTNFLYAGEADKTPLYVHALTVNSYIQSAYKCVKGGSQITKLLIRELRKFGAELHKHSEVSGFGFNEDNSLSWAETTDGRKFYSQNFISNIDIKVLLDKLGSKLPKVFSNRINELKPISSCFSLYLVLKPEKIKAFNHNFYHFKNQDSVWKNANYQPEFWPESYMLSCTESEKFPGFAESFTALTYMNFEEVRQWENTLNTVANPQERGLLYEQFKNEKAEIFMGELEKKFPELRNSIKTFYTSSPLSYRDYIGISGGSMYGFVKDAGNPMKTMFSPKTKIKNLFITGQSVNMHGILGVTIGAFNTCAEVLGRHYLNEKLKESLGNNGL